MNLSRALITVLSLTVTGLLALPALAVDFDSAHQDVYYGTDKGGNACMHVEGKDIFVLLHGDIATPIRLPKKPSFSIYQGPIGTGPGAHLAGFSFARGNIVFQEKTAEINCESLVKATLGVDYYFADFNGDGLFDMLLRGKSANEATIMVAGTAAASLPILERDYGTAALANVNLSDRNLALRIQDVNADGKADVVVEGGAQADYAFASGGAFGQSSSPIFLRAPDVEPATLVGSSQGSFRVDESGAATYSLPISVPAGVAGVAPQVSLNYSSQGGNGPLGKGWSLSGLSAISRCRQTKAIDGSAKPITLTHEDRLCLNGQRLLLTSGSWWAAGSVYHTEIDTFAKVTAQSGVAGLYFTVERKDGSTSYFGATTESQQRILDTPISWAINQFSDSVGNAITYHYTAENNEHLLTSIRYAYGATYAGLVPASGQAKASIELNYAEDRLDPMTSYQLGQQFNVRKRLSSITVYNTVNSSSQPVRDYTLRYLKNTNYADDHFKTSRLASVQECVQSECLPATTFDWSEVQYGFESSAIEVDFTPRGRNQFFGYRALDINGDGFQDILWLEAHQKTNGNFEGHTWFYRLSNGRGGYLGERQAHKVETVMSGVAPWEVLDYNADGRMDFAFYNSITRYWTVVLAAPSSITGDWALSGSTSSSTINIGQFGPGARFVDINSDGLVDVVSEVNGKIRVHLLRRSGEAPESNRFYAYNDYQDLPILGLPPIEPGASLGSIQLHPREGDFNGDGRMDLTIRAEWYWDVGGPGCDERDSEFEEEDICTDDGSYSAIIVAEENSFRYLAMLPSAGPVVDFNADGLPDVLGWKAVHINTGNGFIEQLHTEEIARFKQAQIVDYNYDGYADVVEILVHDDVRKFAKQAKVYLWNPGANRLDAALSIKSSNLSSEHYYQFADVSGDGRVDLLVSGKNSELSIYTGVGVGQPQSTITEIQNGLGARTKIDFKPLSDPQVYSRLQVAVTATDEFIKFDDRMHEPVEYTTYHADAASFYAAINGPWDLPAGSQSIAKTDAVLEVMAPMYVVSRVSGDAPAAGSAPGSVNHGAQSAVSYAYAEAKLQAAGRGFLGFRKIKTLDEQTQVSTTTTYRQDFPFIGHPLSTVVTSTPASGERPILSEAQNTWQFVAIAANGTTRYQNTLQLAEEKTYALADNGNSQGALLQAITTSSNYDNHGNPSDITVTTVGGGETFTKRTVNSYGASAWEAEMGRLSRTVVTTTRPGKAAVTRVSAFTYFTSGSHKGLLREEIVEPDQLAFTLTTAYTYDAWGNKVTATVSGHDIATRTTTHVYSSDGRYLNHSRNALGQKLSWIHDADRNNLGLPLKVYSANGAQVTNLYDALGRKVKESSNDGSYSETLLKRCSSGCPAGAAYYTETSVAGVAGASSQTYYDVLGRPVRESSRAFDGGWNHVDTEYDKLGRVVHKSAPYRTGAPRYWTSIHYDILGRAVETDLPGVATNARVAYNGFDTLHTNPVGQTKTERRNALGELVQVTDNMGGTVVYEYDGAGNLEFTRVTGKVNGVNTTISTQISYDLLGRKQWMNDPDKGVWSYEYYVDGSLKKQTDAKGQVVEFTYDALGRMKTRTDKRANGSLEGSTSWTYDTAAQGLGQLFSVVDSVSGYGEYHSYDTLGRAENVTYSLGVNGSLGEYYQATRYDHLGRVQYSYDAADELPGVSAPKNRVQYSYNSYGYRSTVTDSATGKTIYRILEMDARGNVTRAQQGNGVTTSRTFNAQTGLLEDINANLVGFEVQDQHYVWDDLGNLQSREDRSGVKDISESFSYDALNRLQSTTVSGRAAKTVSYDGHGNIRSKSDVGNYTYGGEAACVSGTNAGPHAVCKTSDGVNYYYDANGNMTTDGTRTLTYSTFDKPLEIKTASHTTRFAYGPSRARYLRTDTDAQNNTKQTLYVGGVEIITHANGDRDIKRSLPGGAQITLTRKASNPSALIVKENYLHHDHLGSVDVITDAAGNVVQALSFDAWGLRRSGETWSDLALNARVNFDSSITTRGFTGHEMLDEVGIIHMNGRIYDARLGRFLQADPFVQEPGLTQSFNRYSYVLNNPLNAIDPSGYFWDKIVDAIVVVASVVLDYYFPGVGTTLRTWWFNGPSQLLSAAENAYYAYNAFNNGSNFTGAYYATQSFLSLPSIGGQSGASNTTSKSNKRIASMVGNSSVSDLTSGKFANGSYTGAFFWAINETAEDDPSTGRVSISWLAFAEAADEALKESAQKGPETYKDGFYWIDEDGNYKHYYVLDTDLCHVSSCNPDNVFIDVNKRSIPFTDAYEDGYHKLLGGPLDFEWAPDLLSPNPILHVSNSALRTSENIALPGHLFDGYVRHSVTVTSSGRVRVTTIGAGGASNKLHAGFNNNVGIQGFSGLHSDLREIYQ